MAEDANIQQFIEMRQAGIPPDRAATLIQEPLMDMDRIFEIESSNNPLAVNEKSGAVGLGQITPIVLEEWNTFFPKQQLDRNDLLKPATNKKVSEWYMNKRIPQLLKHFGLKDTVNNRLISYNAGIGVLLENLKGERDLPEETLNYIEKYKQRKEEK